MRTYTIKKGQHRAGWFFRPIFLAEGLTILFRFHASCLYNNDLGGQLNKLIGISGYAFPFYQDGKWHPGHHWESTRLAWRPADDGEHIAVYRYDYRHGQRSFYRLMIARPGVAYQHTMIAIGRPFMPGYTLYPYFGGQHPAPHTLQLDVGYELFSIEPSFWLPNFNSAGI